MDLKSKKGLKHKIQGFFVRFQDEWQRILQYLEAVLAGNKCVNNRGSELALRVNQVYEITEQMLNDSLQNALSDSWSQAISIIEILEVHGLNKNSFKTHIIIFIDWKMIKIQICTIFDLMT
jgi:hypothetical protein